MTYLSTSLKSDDYETIKTFASKNTRFEYEVLRVQDVYTVCAYDPQEHHYVDSSGKITCVGPVNYVCAGNRTYKSLSYAQKVARELAK